MKGGCPGQAPDADGEYNYAFKPMERRRYGTDRLLQHLLQARRLPSCLAPAGFLFFPTSAGNELRRRSGEMLFWHMTSASIQREMAEYRGYSLQVTYAPPQWQVVIGVILGDRPALTPEKQIVRGWDEEETLKRAKTRIDLLIESPSLN